MASPRLLAALLLLALLAGGAGALAYRYTAGQGAPGGYEVVIQGPEGPLYAGTVQVEAADATALGALQAAARAAGLAVETEEYPGMGTYVRSVGGHRAAGASGWLYEVRHDGRWSHGDRSAAHFPLAPGDAVRWTWTAA